jgi:hypothetical protein
MAIIFAMPALDKAEAYRTDLLINAVVQFEHEPITRSVLAGTNATTQCTGVKKCFNRPRSFF